MNICAIAPMLAVVELTEVEKSSRINLIRYCMLKRQVCFPFVEIWDKPGHFTILFSVFFGASAIAAVDASITDRANGLGNCGNCSVI